MVVRFAKVVWWLGALLLLGAVGIQLAMQPAMPRADPAGTYCTQAFRIDAEQRRSGAVASDAPKSLSQQMAEDSQQVTLDECRAAAAPQTVPTSNRVIGLCALGVPGLVLWALAFIMAGSVWRPPSTRSAASRALAQ